MSERPLSLIDVIVKSQAILEREIAHLRDRILKLEAELALLRGSLAQPTSETLTEYTHDVPPDAPR